MTCNHCHRDFDEYESRWVGKHKGNYCPLCGKWIMWVSQGGDDLLYFGKYKGQKILDVAKKDKEYLMWLMDVCKHNLRVKIEKVLSGDNSDD